MHLGRTFRQRVREGLRVALSFYVLSGVSAGFGLFLIPTIVHLIAGPFPAAAASIGVIAAIPPDQPTRQRGKFWQLLPGAVVAVPLFLGTQLVQDNPLHLGMMLVPAAFVSFLGAAWGKRGIPISMSAMLAVIFSMAVPESEGATPLRSTAYFGIGAFSYVAYATVANAILNARYRVQMLADTLLAIAALMRTQAGQFRPRDDRTVAADPPIGRMLREQAAFADQLQSARDVVLESPRTPRRQKLAGMLLRLLELRDHLLACELDLDLLVTQPGQEPTLTALRETFHALAHEIESLADALFTGRKPHAFKSHRPRLAALQPLIDAEPARPGAASTALLARALADRVGHIDDEALRLIAMARGEIPPDLAIVRANWQMFVSPTSWSLKPFFALWRWDAPPLRHAIRAALAIAVAYVIALELPWGTHPYWILLTITVVLRGSLAVTLERRNARVAGTLLGSLVAGALLAMDAPDALLLAIVPFAQGIAHAFAVRRYIVTSIAATVLALSQAHLLAASVSPTFEAFERIVDTVLGVGIAWAVSYVLPSWERTQIPALVARVLVAHARHARLALGLGQLEAVDNEPELEWRLARREVYDSLSALVQATQRSLAEPRAVRPPLQPLGHLLARSYQLMAQLTAVKTMLLLRRGRLNAEQLAGPLQSTAASIGASLALTGSPRNDAAARTLASTESLQLPDPFEHDLSPWLLRRLYLARTLADQVQADAETVRRLTEDAEAKT